MGDKSPKNAAKSKKQKADKKSRGAVKVETEVKPQARNSPPRL